MKNITFLQVIAILHLFVMAIIAWQLIELGDSVYSLNPRYVDLSGIERKLSSIDSELSGIKRELSGINSELSSIRSKLPGIDTTIRFK